MSDVPPNGQPPSLDAFAAAVEFCGTWCKKLPKGRDITNPSELPLVWDVAEEIVKSKLDIAILKRLSFPAKFSKEYPVILLTGILAAESALQLAKCPPHHLTIVHAMYGEQERIRPKSKEHPDGQDFVRCKLRQVKWLYKNYATKGSSYSYLAVDDGCPNGSGKLMQDLVKEEGFDNVRVAYLQEAIDAGTPPFNQLTSTKDSRKGGAILYGLHLARTQHNKAGEEQKEGSEASGAKTPHIVAYFDADLSADLSLCGLLVAPLLLEGKTATLGQRYGCQGSFLCLPEGANGHPESLWTNTDCMRMIFRHFARGILMPDLAPVYDTQCAFKAIHASALEFIVPNVGSFGPGFDMELLLVAGKQFGKAAQRECPHDGPFSLVPFLFIEDKEGSTMSSNDGASMKSFFQMLKEMVETHDRLKLGCSLTGPDAEWVHFFRSIDLAQYSRLINALNAKLGPTPSNALDTRFDLNEVRQLAQGDKPANSANL